MRKIIEHIWRHAQPERCLSVRWLGAVGDGAIVITTRGVYRRNSRLFEVWRNCKTGRPLHNDRKEARLRGWCNMAEWECKDEGQSTSTIVVFSERNRGVDGEAGAEQTFLGDINDRNG